jgi:hypothetical protein
MQHSVAANMFNIISPKKSLTLLCDNMESKQIWMQKIMEQIDNLIDFNDLHDNPQAFRATVTGSSTLVDEHNKSFTVRLTQLHPDYELNLIVV